MVFIPLGTKLDRTLAFQQSYLIFSNISLRKFHQTPPAHMTLIGELSFVKTMSSHFYET